MYSGKNTEKSNAISQLANLSPKTVAWALVAFGVGVINFGIFNGESSVENYHELKATQKQLVGVVNKLKAENDSLQTEIIKIKQSSSYADKVLRDKYHITEEDEEIIFFAD